MKLVMLLRIAAVVALVQFLAHTTLFLTYSPSHGPEEAQLVEAMKSHVFAFSGVKRSYWDMYFGYGLFSAFNCLLEAVVLWLLANQAQQSAKTVLPLVAAFVMANVVYAILIWTYFFSLPGYFDVSLVVILTWALVVGRTASSPRIEQAPLASAR